jgi:DNA-binding CsgD family transcriptional regulator
VDGLPRRRLVDRDDHDGEVSRSTPAKSAIVRPRADWVRVLEAAYEPVADDRSWGRTVVDAVRPLFRRGDGITMHAIEHDPDCTRGRVLVSCGMGPTYDQGTLADSDMSTLGPHGFRALWYPPAMVTTHSEIFPLLASDDLEIVRSHAAQTGAKDMIGILVHPEPGIALVLACALDRKSVPTRHERLLLSRIGLHLESAYRLRRHPEVVKAVLSVDGARSARHAADAPADRAITEQARRIERSLTKKGRDQPEHSLELWTALVAGRYSVVSRTENGARRYLVLENNPRSHEMRALSQRELDVLSLAARGLSTKLVAYGLGLSPTTVSAALAGAAAKLGLATPLELLRLAATISHDPRSRALPETLTAAETEVLALLREGMSNQQIARIRSRSLRTIANQVASLLRKTDSPSRRALVVEAASMAFSVPKKPRR